MAAVVLVHGLYHRPEHFALVAERLRTAGTQAVVPELHRGSLPADTTAVQAVINSLPMPPTVLGHSYGGSVITGLRRAQNRQPRPRPSSGQRWSSASEQTRMSSASVVIRRSTVDCPDKDEERGEDGRKSHRHRSRDPENSPVRGPLLMGECERHPRRLREYAADEGEQQRHDAVRDGRSARHEGSRDRAQAGQPDPRSHAPPRLCPQQSGQRQALAGRVHEECRHHGDRGGQRQSRPLQEAVQSER
ncbi:alpha/beta fold hydrolase [Streptomyces sp. NPDC057684]|uniref:alpha/beta fold hydrolase n=1 Tax=Streptomyces sp. NPDC057684 TaxID=3346211 RepID=UPI0036A4B7A5